MVPHLLSLLACLRRAPHTGRLVHPRPEVEPLETRTLLSHSPVVHALSFPSDPLYTRGYQWDMNGGYGSNASAAWNAGYTGLDRPAVYVGVALARWR